MADNFQEKTEWPSPKRLQDAREKGDIAKSMEVNTALVLTAGTALLYVMGGMIYKEIALIFQGIFSGGYMTHLNIDNINSYLFQGLSGVGIPTLLFMVGISLIGLTANFIQVGFVFTLEPLIPKPDKINPFKGVKKIFFSKRSLEEVFKNLLKLGIVVFIAYWAIIKYKNNFFPLADQSVWDIARFMATSGLSVCFKIALALMVIAIADYIFQRFEHFSNLKMTKQEVKDELKQMEGDPKVKGRIRTVQMQLSRNRMMQEVQNADVVITNPTHYAVAIKYDSDAMAAPKVVAKGKNYIALKIREIAEEYNIPIMEDPPLAQALFKAVELNQQIPERFFQALAEVLAYVYKLKNKLI